MRGACMQREKLTCNYNCRRTIESPYRSLRVPEPSSEFSITRDIKFSGYVFDCTCTLYALDVHAQGGAECKGGD